MSQYLIRGVAYPLTFDSGGRLKVSIDEQHIKESITQILLTCKGSVPFNPDFGSNIRKRAFDPTNAGALIKADAVSAIIRCENRVDNVSVTLIDPSSIASGEICYKVTYRIKGRQELQELIQIQGI